MKAIKVGVFEHPGKRKVCLMAYTLWYDRAWDGCCEHTVQAESGATAKLIAKREHQERCMKESNV